MEKIIRVNEDTARKWYLSGNKALIELALSVYKEDELLSYDDIYYKVKTNQSYVFKCAAQDGDKFKFNSRLSVLAAYFNKDWQMKTGKTGYFISKAVSNRIDPIIKEFPNIGITKHESVMYPGIVYFKNKKDVEKVMLLLKDDLYMISD